MNASKLRNWACNACVGHACAGLTIKIFYVNKSFGLEFFVTRTSNLCLIIIMFLLHILNFNQAFNK